MNWGCGCLLALIIAIINIVIVLAVDKIRAWMNRDI
jgi:hypothetical protein